MQLGFNVATERCYGCKTCSVACAREHLLENDVILRRVRQIDIAEPIGHAFISMSCNHCDVPICIEYCPVRSFYKDEETGLVLRDASICIGCKTCIEVCPFNAPVYDVTNSVVQKCDGCITRLSAGMLPVCNEVCPSANITLDESDSLVNRFPDSVSIKAVVPEPGPNLFVSLDPDITAQVFLDIDGFEGTVDTGNGRFPV